MRELTRFSDPLVARRLGDVLLAEGIKTVVNSSREGQSVVWVYDENQLPPARALCTDFLAAPDDPRYDAAVHAADDLRKQEQKAESRRPRIIQVRDRFLPTSRGLGPVSAALIVFSVVVAVLTRLGADEHAVRVLSFVSFERGGGFIHWDGLADLRAGQIYRVVTPIFLHFGAMHLLFNMWWIKDLGTMIERRQASWFLGLMVLVLAVASNTAQYLVSGPAFGGMSGVVYGLFGYIWIRGRFDPGSGYGLAQQDVVWMMLWLVLCFTGAVGPTANTCHTVGLVGGALWGYLASRAPRRRKA